jgi:hypothetical protein
MTLVIKIKPSNYEYFVANSLKNNKVLITIKIK